MRRKAGGIRILLMAAAIVLAAVSSAFAAIPSPPSPPRLFNDFAGMLDTYAAERLEAELLQYEKETSAQLAVVTVDNMDGDYIESYAVKLFEAWGIGRQSADDGILLLIAEEERKVRIEVGYGLEGEINDSKAGRILDEYFTPSMRAGNVEKAISDTMQAIRSEITGVPLAPSENELSPLGRVILIVIAVIIIILVLAFMLFISKIKPPGGPSMRPPFTGFGGPWSSGPKNFGGFGGFGGGKSGGGFGGFGGGRSGGGGASRGW